MSNRPVRVVVGFALSGDGRCLMAKRRAGDLRPMWELPGGKCNDGETDAAALKREWREELGVEAMHIEVVRRLHVKQYEFEVPFTLVTYFVRLNPAAKPQPLVSDELRWVYIGDAIKWLPCVPATYDAFPHLKGLPGVVVYAPPAAAVVPVVSVVTHAAEPTLDDQIRQHQLLTEQINQRRAAQTPYQAAQSPAQSPRPRNGFVQLAYASSPTAVPARGEIVDTDPQDKDPA